MEVAKQIKEYILENQNDDVGTWEYGHTPYLTNMLNHLNQTEADEFCNKVLEWNDDELLYLISLSIYMSHNKYLDATSLYIKIFSKIKDIEYLEILVENNIPFIRPPYNTIDKIKDWSTDQIESLKQNVLQAMSIKSNSWNETLNKVVEYLNNLKQINGKHTNNKTTI